MRCVAAGSSAKPRSGKGPKRRRRSALLSKRSPNWCAVACSENSAKTTCSDAFRSSSWGSQCCRRTSRRCCFAMASLSPGLSARSTTPRRRAGEGNAPGSSTSSSSMCWPGRPRRLSTAGVQYQADNATYLPTASQKPQRDGAPEPASGVASSEAYAPDIRSCRFSLPSWSTSRRSIASRSSKPQSAWASTPRSARPPTKRSRVRPSGVAVPPRHTNAASNVPHFHCKTEISALKPGCTPSSCKRSSKRNRSMMARSLDPGDGGSAEIWARCSASARACSIQTALGRTRVQPNVWALLARSTFRGACRRDSGEGLSMSQRPQNWTERSVSSRCRYQVTNSSV
mmetsp:Transcript_107640/g.309825  ORF Transcript_107640/g.309825 Transcript_107640/m.309825 type:complete len:342 (-) Transcript_107640:130-1155(-)